MSNKLYYRRPQNLRSQKLFLRQCNTTNLCTVRLQISRQLSSEVRTQLGHIATPWLRPLKNYGFESVPGHEMAVAFSMPTKIP